jgi:hypothetical protein
LEEGRENQQKMIQSVSQQAAGESDERERKKEREREREREVKVSEVC